MNTQNLPTRETKHRDWYDECDKWEEKIKKKWRDVGWKFWSVQKLGLNQKQAEKWKGIYDNLG